MTALFFAAVLLQESPTGALDETATRGLVAQFRKSQHWALKCVVLSALGTRWHPAGAGILLEALQSKDLRLRAYALEALRRADPATLRSAATKEVVEELVSKQSAVSHAFYRERLAAVLRALSPEIKTKDPADWTRWWRGIKESYVPPPWTPPDKPKESGRSGTVAEKFVERAFDLNAAGVEVVVCLDTTGSMQPTIDAARAGLADLVAILRGIAPRFRLGLVHYRDLEDYKDGAQILAPLSDKVEAVQSKLAGLQAGGGGDFPERVEKGLELALHPQKIGWQAATNKIVVVIGDAPPHPEDLEKAKSLAKGAREKPFGMKPDVASGKEGKPRLRPFMISTIGVGMSGVSSETEKAFRDISEAGGGAYGALITGENGKSTAGASEKIVAHILSSSFGPEWAKATEAFVETYLEYRRNGFLR